MRRRGGWPWPRLGCRRLRTLNMPFASARGVLQKQVPAHSPTRAPAPAPSQGLPEWGRRKAAWTPETEVAWVWHPGAEAVPASRPLAASKASSAPREPGGRLGTLLRRARARCPAVRTTEPTPFLPCLSPPPLVNSHATENSLEREPGQPAPPGSPPPGRGALASEPRQPVSSPSLSPRARDRGSCRDSGRHGADVTHCSE